MNKQVVFNSILALVFLALSLKVDWIFMVGAVVLVYINQRIITKGKVFNSKKNKS